MEIEPLLIEQRRVGDEFRIVEEAVQQMHKTLAERRLDAVTRSQIEACAISTTTELRRLGQRRLDLDASVCAQIRERSSASSRDAMALGNKRSARAMSEKMIRLSKADLDDQLNEALKDSFPASDPVTIGEASSSVPDRPLHRRPAVLDTELVNELAHNVEVTHARPAMRNRIADVRRGAPSAVDDSQQQSAPSAIGEKRRSSDPEQRALSNAVSNLDSRD